MLGLYGRIIMRVVLFHGIVFYQFIPELCLYTANKYVL